MTLLNSEQLLSRIDTGNGELVLTSHRVVHGCQNQFTSIMLADVGSVVVARLTHRWMLFVTGTCVAMGACLVGMSTRFGSFEPVNSYRQLASALLFLSAFLVVTFGVKRFSMVRISSAGAAIGFRIRSAIRRDMNRFLLDLDEARIVWYLVEKTGQTVNGEVEISLSREELAQMTGTTLFTVSRVLSAWEARGIVKPRREGVTICDIVSLRAISSVPEEGRLDRNRDQHSTK